LYKINKFFHKEVHFGKKLFCLTISLKLKTKIFSQKTFWENLFRRYCAYVKVFPIEVCDEIML